MRAAIPPAPIHKLSYTIEEAVEATGICRSTLYEARAAGELRMKKRGRSTIILTDELVRYLEALPDMPER